MFKLKQGSKNNKIFLEFKNINRDTRQGVRLGLYFAGEDLVAEARRSILEKPKGGKTYIIYKDGRKRRHVSSAPGEAPANLTRALRKSIDFKVRGYDKLTFGANTPYARALELGNPKRNLEARPYLIAAINKKQQDIRNQIEREIARRIKRL